MLLLLLGCSRVSDSLATPWTAAHHAPLSIKMWYIYTMGYYSAIKMNEMTPFGATWMDLESVILSEVNQTEKEKYHMVPLICGS